MDEFEKQFEIVDCKLLDSMCWIPTSRPVPGSLYVLAKYVYFVKVTANFFDMLPNMCFFNKLNSSVIFYF